MKDPHVEDIQGPGQPVRHTIRDHPGILGIRVVQDQPTVQIDFDSSRLNEAEVRQIAREHITSAASSVRRCALRLDGQACEAAAARLERRIENVPGVRRATATYIGRVLCITFDGGVSSEEQIVAGAKEAGARVSPLQPSESRTTFREGLFGGRWLEEISCATGLLFLVAAAVADHWLGKSLPVWILYGGAYAFAGQFGLRSALASLRERTLDVDLLMILAALGAAIVQAPFEGALLLFLFSFSNVLQRYAMERTQKAIESLLTLRPKTALVLRDGRQVTVAVEDLRVGEVVMVRPGALIPVDGLIVEGSTTIDESSLTGESMPVNKAQGSQVFAGTLNQVGAIDVRVARAVEDSTLAHMVRLVAEAQAEKSATQRFLERAEQYYAAGVMAFTILVFLIPWLFFGESFPVAFYRAMTLLVVASPCALVISTPATVLSAIGGAARRGILIKGGSHLENAARIDVVALDKTGTITVGKPSVTAIVTPQAIELLDQPLSEEARKRLTLCAALESKSEHPLGAAVVRGARQLGLVLPVVSEFRSTPGKGAEATIENQRVIVGSERFFLELGARDMGPLQEKAAPLQSAGKTCIWLGIRCGNDVVTLAAFALADTLRPGAREVIAELKAMGVKKIVMLTGDQNSVAAAIAGEAGVDQFQAELLPAGKVEALRKLRTEGRVMMVGDGVNDAPALALADVGVAMGAAGTDVAMETADVVLMGDRLENIPLLLGLARKARRVMNQNLVFASSVIAVLVLAALGLALPLPLGVIGHEGSTVIVCLSGLRLLLYKKPPQPRR